MAEDTAGYLPCKALQREGGGAVPGTFLVPFKLLPQTSGSYHCCPGADRGQGFLLQLFSTGAAFKRKRVRAPGDHKGRRHCYLNRLRTATLAYFYLLADQHTSFSEGFYSNANKSQARWGEHDASPSFPKTQARPSTQKGSVLWGWLHKHFSQQTIPHSSRPDSGGDAGNVCGHDRRQQCSLHCARADNQDRELGVV